MQASLSYYWIGRYQSRSTICINHKIDCQLILANAKEPNSASALMK